MLRVLVSSAQGRGVVLQRSLIPSLRTKRNCGGMNARPQIVRYGYGPMDLSVSCNREMRPGVAGSLPAKLVLAARGRELCCYRSPALQRSNYG